MAVLSLVLAASIAGLPARSSRASQSLPLSFTASQQDDDVVRVNTDLVLLNATVLDRSGKFVEGLKRADFHVFEDGKEQKLASFSAEETPFAAAILLDMSGSMETRLTLARGAAIRFLDSLRDEDVAAVYSFDVKVERWQDFSPGRDLPAIVFGLHTKPFYEAPMIWPGARKRAAPLLFSPTAAKTIAALLRTKPSIMPSRPRPPSIP